MAAARKNKKQPSFEDSLEQLEAIVEALEEGDLPLEQALVQFEQGIALTRSCQAALAQAEQTVKVLIDAGGEETADLTIDDDETSDDQ